MRCWMHGGGLIDRPSRSASAPPLLRPVRPWPVGGGGGNSGDRGTATGEGTHWQRCSVAALPDAAAQRTTRLCTAGSGLRSRAASEAAPQHRTAAAMVQTQWTQCCLHCPALYCAVPLVSSCGADCEPSASAALFCVGLLCSPLSPVPDVARQEYRSAGQQQHTRANAQSSCLRSDPAPCY